MSLGSGDVEAIARFLAGLDELTKTTGVDLRDGWISIDPYLIGRVCNRDGNYQIEFES